MLRIRSNVANYTSIGTTNLLTFGAAPGIKIKLIEIRCTNSSSLETMINIFVNGELRFQIPPTLIETAFVIDEDMPESCEIRAEVVRAAATAQFVSVSFLYDDKE